MQEEEDEWRPPTGIGDADGGRSGRSVPDPEPSSTLIALEAKKRSSVPVAEVTTTDLRKTRYQVESKDDIRKTREGYKIETADGDVLRFSEEDVESISVVEE